MPSCDPSPRGSLAMLPPEIRDELYSYLMPNSSRWTDWGWIDLFEPIQAKREVNSQCGLAILRTSRAIYEEVSSLLRQRELTLVLDGWRDLTIIQSKRMKTPPSQHVPSIRILIALGSAVNGNHLSGLKERVVDLIYRLRNAPRIDHIYIAIMEQTLRSRLPMRVDKAPYALDTCYTTLGLVVDEPQSSDSRGYGPVHSVPDVETILKLFRLLLGVGDVEISLPKYRDKFAETVLLELADDVKRQMQEPWQIWKGMGLGRAG